MAEGVANSSRAVSEADVNSDGGADGSFGTPSSIALDWGVSLEHFGYPAYENYLLWRGSRLFPIDCAASTDGGLPCADAHRDSVEKTLYLEVVGTHRRATKTLYVLAGQAPGNTMCANFSAWLLDVGADHATLSLIATSCYVELRVVQWDPVPVVELAPNPGPGRQQDRWWLPRGGWRKVK